VVIEYQTKVTPAMRNDKNWKKIKKTKKKQIKAHDRSNLYPNTINKGSFSLFRRWIRSFAIVCYYHRVKEGKNIKKELEKRPKFTQKTHKYKNKL
jgi:hypothetical protein